MSYEKKMKDLLSRLVDMSPEPPPYPEEMTMASKETSSRKLHPAFVFAGAVALVALLAVPVILLTGGETPLAADTTTTSTTLEPSTSEEISSTTSVPSTSTTTTTQTTTTTIASVWQGTVLVYQEPGNSFVSNPALVPLPIEVAGLDDGAYFTESLAVIESSLPEGMFSAIPTDIQVVGLTEQDGIVVADMNQAFGEFGSGSFAEFSLLNQLVYNLTIDRPDDGVLFTVEGEPVEFFGGHGIELTDPIDRETFLDSRALIFLTEPIVQVGEVYRVNGIANTFEATVRTAVVDSQDVVTYENFTTATCGTGCWGEFGFEIPADVVTPGESSVQVFSSSPEDGLMTDVITIPIPDGRIWSFNTG